MGYCPAYRKFRSVGQHQPDPGRAALWLSLAPCVKGAEHVRFIKLHCHGAPEQNARTILGQAMRHTLEHLLKCYNDGETYKLAFMTCWEMYRLYMHWKKANR